MISSANVMSDNLNSNFAQASAPTEKKLTLADIQKQEAFLQKEKDRIQLEEEMMKQQEKIRQEILKKQ